MKYIVENFTKESSYIDLVKAIKSEGHDLKEIKGEFKYSDIEGYDSESPVLFLGSINMTKIVSERLYRCYPVIYCHRPSYLCSRYMSYFGKYLFNDRYAIISLRELQRQRFLYYGIFGKEALIFIRPDSGEKPFQAQLLDILDLDRFCDTNKNIEHELVVVSTPKTINWEGRFIVTNKKEIIAYSTYQFQGQVTKIPSVPGKTNDLVKELLNISYYPDSIFVMDICEDGDNNFWLLELNSFSSSGLYECNKVDIVKRVSAIAEEEWKAWRINFTHS